jgi:hypothetical protein
MTRSLSVLTLVLTTAVSVSFADELAEDRDGVQVVVAKNSATSSVAMVKTPQRVYVRVGTGAVAIRGNSVRQTVRKLKARSNNVYSLAINTDGIARATSAVKTGGRVYLRASGSTAPAPTGRTETRVAKK